MAFYVMRNGIPISVLSPCMLSIYLHKAVPVCVCVSHQSVFKITIHLYGSSSGLEAHEGSPRDTCEPFYPVLQWLTPPLFPHLSVSVPRFSYLRNIKSDFHAVKSKIVLPNKKFDEPLSLYQKSKNQKKSNTLIILII